MAETTDIKSVEDLQKYLDALVPKDSPLRKTESWPGDYISLRPVLPNQQIAVVVPGEDGQKKDYTLWLEKGQNGFDRFVLATPEILNEVLGREVIDGIIAPINSEYNPITRKHVPGGEYESKDTLWKPDGTPAGFEGKKIWVAFNPKAVPPSGRAISNDEIANIQRPLIVQEWIVDAKLEAEKGATVLPKDRRAGYKLEPAYNTHVMREPGVADLKAKADEFERAVASVPARVLTISPEILGQAAAQQLFIKTQVAPREPVIPPVRDKPGAIIDMDRAAQMYAAAQVPGGPLEEPLNQPFARAHDNKTETGPASEVVVDANQAGFSNKVSGAKFS